MANLSFIGDIGLNDAFITLKKNGANPFEALEGFLSGSDLVVGNLECVLKGNGGENLLKRPRIHTTADTMHYLKNINLSLVTLATNHIYDNLDDGFHNTLEFLKMQQIKWLGAGMSREVATQSITLTIKGISFCFMNYITADTNPSLPDDAGVSINEFHEEACLAELKKYVDYDYRIVIMHWGGNFEGGLYPDYHQKGLGRKLIDHGADLIIGHHSHTLQPFERYKGKYIFYSLGNFCFADIHFEGKVRKMSSLRERESVIVNITFSKANYRVKLIPFRSEDLNLVVRKGVLVKLWMRNILWQLMKFKGIWLIYKLWFNHIRPLITQLTRKDPKRSLLHRIAGQISRRFLI